LLAEHEIAALGGELTEESRDNPVVHRHVTGIGGVDAEGRLAVFAIVGADEQGLGDLEEFAVEFVQRRFDGVNAVAFLTAPSDESRGEVSAPAPAPASSKGTVFGKGPNIDAMKSATGEAVKN